MSTRTYILEFPREREWALRAVREAGDDCTVEVKPTKRTDDQNRRFHAMVGDIAKAGIRWAGKTRNTSEWKVLLVSGHAVATKEGAEMVPGLEGEFVNIRESTATMSKRRGASLIEYTRAFGDEHGVQWSEPKETE